MALILNIDTSTEQASLSIAKDGVSISMMKNREQKDHASWLQPALIQSLHEAGVELNNIQAVGITSGPGSYTGLRVGMATAKGLCYALKLPLITVNTLEAMASVALAEDVDYICPMLDAKRMEVFSALYSKNLEAIIPPVSMILNQHSFLEYLKNSRIIFFGSGFNKFEKILHHSNAVFKNLSFDCSYLSKITIRKFLSSEFTDLAQSEPEYFKEFYRTN